MAHDYEMAVFWFGAVTSQRNYVDVRVGFNESGLTVFLNVIDRLLWYDPDQDFSKWDSVSLYVNPGDQKLYRLDSLLSWDGSAQSREQFQTSYMSNGQSWIPAGVSFTTTSGWRGNAPGDYEEDRGWSTVYEIPFTSMGLSTRPADGQPWRMAVVLHDRDDEAGTPIPDTIWPETFKPLTPSTWGTLVFGIPVFQPPESINPTSLTLRHRLNGASVVDGEVGGHTLCGEGLDFWNAWGNTTYPGYDQINVQNQADVSDFPCFSKIYITFPLSAVPPGKKILNATLTMVQFGNSDPSGAYDSLIQVSTLKENWNETTLSWNNAPLAYENVGQQWVNPIGPPWPNVEHHWDLSRAVSQAYSKGEPLRLVLYSADTAMHSGKYFTSSDTNDGNAINRPRLDLTWVDSR